MSTTGRLCQVFLRGARIRRHLPFFTDKSSAFITPCTCHGSWMPGAHQSLSERLHVPLARYHSTSVPTNAIYATSTTTEQSSSDPAVVLDAINVLKSILQSKSMDGPQKADQILQHLEDRKVMANFECLFWAIECWSRTKRKGAEERIEELYHQLWQCFEREMTSTNEDIKSTRREEQKIKIQITMMRVLKAYHHASNAHRSEDLLLQFADNYRSDRQVPTTLEMCKSVLATWSRSESSRRAIRAEKLLSLMSKDSALPDPDITCYTMVLNCWASSNKDNAPQRAELLLRSMELAEDESMRSNLVSYSCVLNAWARSKEPDAPEQAERLLHEMEETKGWVVDRVVYTAMISVWGRSNRPKSITKAEEYFQRLQSLQTASNKDSEEGRTPIPKATVVEYTALIQAWAYHVANNVNESRRAVDRVEELLEELMEKYFTGKAGGDPDAEAMRPNRLTFASVFRTIAAARRIPNREDRANRALGEMEKLNLEPTTYIMNLIEKCSRLSSNETSKKPKRMR